MDIPQTLTTEPISVQPAPSASKPPLIFVGLLLILAAGAGGIYLGRYLYAPNPSAGGPETTQKIPTGIPSAAPTVDPIADWKTYTWNGVSFKFPDYWFAGGNKQAPLFYIDQNITDNPNYKMTLYDLAVSAYNVQINDPIGTRKEIGDKIFEEKIADVAVSGEIAAKIKKEVLPGSATDARPGIAVRLNHNSKILNFEIVNPTAAETRIFDQILSTFRFTE